jgi:hypothetical protein
MLTEELRDKIKETISVSALQHERLKFALEKLEIIPDTEQWLEHRETRNLVTHEYSYHQDEYVEGLNKLYHYSLILSDLWQDIKKYAEKKFQL